MAAPARTVGVSTYVQEIASGACTVFQQVPAVGAVCQTLLALEQLVETAKGNKDELAKLLELCDMLTKGVLEKCSKRKGPCEGLAALGKHVERAKGVAKLCNRGRFSRYVLGLKISKDIDSVTKDVLATSTVISLILNIDNHQERQDLAVGAGRVKVPNGAPHIRDWYVEREAAVAETCDRLGIKSSGSFCDKPRVVGLVGPGGSGKSTMASMVVTREDVRAYFSNRVLWLSVGQEGRARLPEIMLRLAEKVYETVLLKGCRPPRKAGVGVDPEDGAAYIHEQVDESSRRFLVVADDVWEVEVLHELERTGAWVLYTSRDILFPHTPVRLDQVLQEEAESVLRRAAELDDDARLPDAAFDLIKLCDFVVMDLAFVGRWSLVRGRTDGKAWQKALDRILYVQQLGEGGRPLSWRTSVLRVGLEELACDNPLNKELYLSLAVLPKGLSFCAYDAAVLLYGNEHSDEDVKAARGVAETLERLSILTLESGNRYRVHDDHAVFVVERLARYPDTQGRALPRWQKYISTIDTLFSCSGEVIVKIWGVFELVAGMHVSPTRPYYDEALDAMDPFDAKRPAALRAAALFHWLRGEFAEAYDKTYQLLEVERNTAGENCLEVARTLHGMGGCSFNAGRTKDAINYFERALAVFAEKLNPDHPDMARPLHCLGLCASSEGRTQKAEELLRRALCIRERSLGAEHPDVGRTLYALGVCASSAGRPGEADELFRRALLILEEKLGPNALDVARILHELGLRAAKVKQMEKAGNFLRRALCAREENLGPHHPDVQSTKRALLAISNATQTKGALGPSHDQMTSGESTNSHMTRRQPLSNSEVFRCSGKLAPSCDYPSSTELFVSTAGVPEGRPIQGGNVNGGSGFRESCPA